MASSSSAAFSPSMTLAGMDYIAPSAACIKPTLMANAEGSSAASGAVGVTRGGNAFATSSGFQHADVVKITLQDCLACSGCVTTAETVLVNAQSRQEIVAALLSPAASTAPDADATAPSRLRPRLVSVSSQSCASLAAYLGVPMSEAYAIVAGFMRAVLTPAALRAAAAAAAAAAGADEEKPSDSGGAPLPCAPAPCSACEPPVYVVGLEWAEQLSAALTAQEYERRRRLQQATAGASEAAPLPMIVSACPGWVCYCEKQGGALLPHLCPVMSAQGIAGSYAKRAVAADAYHISIQPCFDRKLEAARDSMPAAAASSPSSPAAEDGAEAPVFYTDCVLSTAELLEWMKEVDAALPWRGALDTDDAAAHPRGAHPTDGDGAAEEDAPPAAGEVPAHAHDAARLAGSGGYHRCVIAQRLRSAGVHGGPAAAITYVVKRNHNHQLATSAGLPGEVFCIGYGFQQIQNVVRGIKKRMPAMRSYTFIELMACPDGCLNGGGQVRPAQQPHTEVLTAVIDAFARHSAPAGAVGDSAKACDGVEEEAMLLQRRRVERESSLHQPGPFANATIAAVAPTLGEALWRCAFRDREKEFAEMLNAGNVHSLKW